MVTLLADSTRVSIVRICNMLVLGWKAADIKFFPAPWAIYLEFSNVLYLRTFAMLPEALCNTCSLAIFQPNIGYLIKNVDNLLTINK